MKCFSNRNFSRDVCIKGKNIDTNSEKQSSEKVIQKIKFGRCSPGQVSGNVRLLFPVVDSVVPFQAWVVKGGVDVGPR